MADKLDNLGPSKPQPSKRLKGDVEAEEQASCEERLMSMMDQMQALMGDIKLTMEGMKLESGIVKKRVDDLELRVSSSDDRVVALEKRVAVMGESMGKMERASQDRDNVWRRKNLRIIGFPEGVEKGNPVFFLQLVLPEILRMSPGKPLDIEWARRSPQKSSSSQSPGAFVVRFLRLTTKEMISKKAKELQSVFWSEKKIKISFYNDLSKPVLDLRKQFWEAKGRAREKKLKFYMLYPAVFKVVVNGQLHSFLDPKKAVAFLDGEEYMD